MRDTFFILRIGSNAEKNYIYKTVPFFDAVIAKSNFFESSPGLLSSLFIKLNIQKSASSYIIDPNTYVFAMNPFDSWSIRSWVKCRKSDAINKVKDNLRINTDDEALKSIREIQNPTIRDKDKVEVFLIKNSYRKLADKLLPMKLSEAIGNRALFVEDFMDDRNVIHLVDKTIDYQCNALESRFNKEKYKDFRVGLIPPKFILSPYFAISDDTWLNLMQKIWLAFDSQYSKNDSGIVLLVEKNYFTSNVEKITDLLIKSRTTNIFFWVSRFKEETANEEELSSYVRFVTQLNRHGKRTFSLFSGGLSTFMIPFGLSGITNATGYGMDRDIEPVQGGVPTAQYYIPTLHLRQQVLESYNLILENEIGVTKEDFHSKICSCPIFVNGIQNNASEMLQYFGELGDVKIDKGGIRRRYPAQIALERCNFHFILSRLLEYRWAKQATCKDSILKLEKEIELWKNTHEHLNRWLTILQKEL